MDDKAKAKISALLAKAGDSAASESEAATALAMARKLMDRHGVSESDLATVTNDDFTSHFEHGRQTKFGPALHPVDALCMSAVANFCGVVCLFQQTTRRMRLHGLKADVEFALWFRAALIRQFDQDWSNYKALRENRALRRLPEARRSFATGFASALEQRLDAYKRTSTGGGTGTDLVVQKTAVAKRNLVDSGVAISGGTARAFSAADAAASGAGYNSGMSASTGRGVKYGNNLKQLGHR